MLHPDPRKIIVPRKHGELLIEPPLAAMADAVAHAPEFWSEHTDATPWRTRRDTARREFLAAAQSWAKQIDQPFPPLDPDRPFIITGHQVEFYHAGVWAKVIAADELARRTNSTAFDLLVDHDLVDHRGFDLPVQSPDGNWSRQPIEFAPPSPLPVEHLPAPTRDTFDTWDASLAAIPAAHTDALATFLSHLHPTAATISYTAWMSRARSRFEAALGLHVHHIPTSLLCSIPSWHQFVCAWIDNADPWTAAYNTHLAAYRTSHDIKNAQHPMPDLARSQNGGGAEYELPFWIYKKNEPRQRLMIRKLPENPPENALIVYNNEELPFQSVFTTLNSEFNIRPRALTLTMFVRLYLADLFIHGIGGALYDQITDPLMQQLFHLAPPYGCVSAAWLLPLAQPQDAAADLPSLTHLRHHALHNPQQFINPFTALKTDVAEKIRDRAHLVEQLTASVKSSRKDPTAKAQRHNWFNELHTLNDSLHQHAPIILRRLDDDIAHAHHTQQQNKTLQWREYFFPLHTTHSLETLIAKTRE